MVLNVNRPILQESPSPVHINMPRDSLKTSKSLKSSAIIERFSLWFFEFKRANTGLGWQTKIRLLQRSRPQPWKTGNRRGVRLAIGAGSDWQSARCQTGNRRGVRLAIGAVEDWQSARCQCIDETKT